MVRRLMLARERKTKREVRKYRDDSIQPTSGFALTQVEADQTAVHSFIFFLFNILRKGYLA